MPLRRITALATSCVLALALLAPAPSAVSPAFAAVRPRTAPRTAPGHVVLRLRTSPTPAALAAIAAAVGGQRHDARRLHGDLLTVKLPRGVAVTDAVDALQRVPQVVWAEGDQLGEPLGYTPPLYAEPNDPGWTNPSALGAYANGRSWWLRDLAMDALWQRTLTGTDTAGHYPLRSAPGEVKVAVLDSGLYPHADLGDVVGRIDECAAYSSATGTFTTDSDVTPDDPSLPGQGVGYASHGTFIAGEIAAAAGNGAGAVGLGWDTEVVAYKIAGPWIEGDSSLGVAPGQVVWLDSACAAGIMQAADDGCKVINISAGWQSSAAIQDAVDYAHDRGAIVVAAAGNSGTAGILSPASCKHALAVGSYGLDAGRNRVRSGFDSYGPQMALLAPGEEIWGLYKPDVTGALGELGYTEFSGTSMASPVVAGALAYVWRTKPSLTAEQVSALATATADDIGAPGFDAYTGWGAIDPLRMYQVANAPTVTRIGGRDRYRVNIALSRARFASADHVVVVSGATWPDALSSAPLAEAYAGPVLLTGTTALPGSIASEISRLHATKATVVGGTGSVSAGVVTQLRALHLAVDRIGGADRYDVASRVALRLASVRGSIAESTALVASGAEFRDALAGSAVAAREGWPVLLVRPTGAPPATTAGALRSLGITRTVVVGPPASVAPATVARLPHAVRVGADGSAGQAPGALAAWAQAAYPGDFPGTEYALASSTAFADGLGAAGFSAGRGACVLLTPGYLSADTSETLSAGRGQIATVTVVGGEASVSGAAESAVRALLVP